MTRAASIWLFQFFRKMQAAAFLKYRIASRSKSSCKHRKEGILTTYCEVVNYLLGTYATEDEGAKSIARIMRFTQPLNETVVNYAELLCAKLLFCVQVYDEYLMKGNFI